MMRASLHRLCPMFNTHRMVEDYWDAFYRPAAESGALLTDQGGEGLKRLALWRERVMYNWSNVAIKDIRMDEIADIEVGNSYHVEADIELGELSPDDVIVEAYCGKLDSGDQFTDRFTRVMLPEEKTSGSPFRYRCDIQFRDAGHYGLNLRLTPNHPDPMSRHAMGLVIWGGQ